MTGDPIEPELHTNAGSSESTPSTNFRGQIVETCEGYIRQFKRGELDRIDVLRALSSTIFNADTGTDEVEGMEEARKSSFANFLDQVDEISRSRVEGLVRGKAHDKRTQQKAVPDIIFGGDDDEEVADVLRRGRSPSEASSAERPGKRERSPSDEDAKHTGKKPFVKANLPFIANRQRRLSITSLHPDLQETLRCKSIYSQDVTAAKQALICEPDCPQLPDPLWNDVLLSRFVDLDRILSALHSIDGDAAETYKVGDLELSTGPTKPKMHIATAGEWTSAFERYKEGVLFCYPHRDKELNAYAAHIIRHFTAVGESNAIRVIHYATLWIDRNRQYILHH
ncbi:hypothetical protein BC629DRAFT_918702 [Irpex lacteus]|nr:hypothetical protein BC629DRAFT_918702 [Irpex lacteus]